MKIIFQVDMIMNEFDDERTIDEEETMTQEDEAEELNALKDEQDMPIEELLKMYGYGNKDAAKDPDAEAGPSSEAGGAADDAEVDPEDDEEEDEDGDEEEKTEGEKVQQDEEKEEKGEELVTQVRYFIKKETF